MLTHFRKTSTDRPKGPQPADSFETHKRQKPTRQLPTPNPASPGAVDTVRSRSLGPNTHLMINRNMAQKHISTANTESMLENSATDTSIAVMATNMVAAAHTDLRRGGIAVEGRRRRHRKTVFPGGTVRVGGDSYAGPAAE